MNIESNKNYVNYFKKFFNNESFTFENFDILESYCDHYMSDYLFNISYFDKLYKTGINLQEFYNHCKKSVIYKYLNCILLKINILFMEMLNFPLILVIALQYQLNLFVFL